MSHSISSTTAATSTAPTASTGATDAAAMEKFESLMGQNLIMRMQQNQQAMTKSMNKMTDAIKQSMQDEE
ncbi:hypothetical protein [Roseateles amylovorans]|uniref:Uncharacterized protein n=1 Tax=Roseateles amylovorans TaxID=2978473 RepID=A0ABY6B2S3_9BURK|nr:hypothetical protein [Roseateles amylovorans]UXH78274.1 hypothetical protein N4261_25555 [Roseateles amylovorans]